MRRRIRPNVAEFPDLATREQGPAEVLEGADRAAAVKEALSQLDETTRTAVVMRYYEGLSAKEIGEALEMSPAAVDMRLSRARGQLRGLLAPVAGEETGGAAGVAEEKEVLPFKRKTTGA